MAEERASTVQIEVFMKGIELPAGKDDLINHAKKNNAPDNVIAVLSRLPEKDYRSATDISHEVGQVE